MFLNALIVRFHSSMKQWRATGSTLIRLLGKLNLDLFVKLFMCRAVSIFFYLQRWFTPCNANSHHALQVLCGGRSHITCHTRSGDQSLHRWAVEHGSVQNHRSAPHTLCESHTHTLILTIVTITKLQELVAIPVNFL